MTYDQTIIYNNKILLLFLICIICVGYIISKFLDKVDKNEKDDSNS